MSYWRQWADGQFNWRWLGIPEPRPLYGLDRLAAKTNAPVLVTEGEKAADAAGSLFSGFVAITSPNEAMAAEKADWSPLVGRRVVLWPDNDEAGDGYAGDVVRLAMAAGATSVAVVEVPATFPDKWDLADEPPEGWGIAELTRLLLEAKQPAAENVKSTTLDEDTEIQRLAGLPPLTYERERIAAAARLNVRIGILDRAVKAARSGIGAPSGPGRSLELPAPEPWPEPVNGETLLLELTEAIRRYLVMEAGSAEAAALWVVHAHALDAFSISPRLAITSPERGCGKTTLLDVLGALCRAIANGQCHCTRYLPYYRNGRANAVD